MTENLEKCAGEVDLQMAHGVCRCFWPLRGPSCQAQRSLSASAPVSPESGSGLEQGTAAGAKRQQRQLLRHRSGC